jgi:hypothetical protein
MDWLATLPHTPSKQADNSENGLVVGVFHHSTHRTDFRPHERAKTHNRDINAHTLAPTKHIDVRELRIYFRLLLLLSIHAPVELVGQQHRALHRVAVGGQPVLRQQLMLQRSLA